jgi:hypothetical protein
VCACPHLDRVDLGVQVQPGDGVLLAEELAALLVKAAQRERLPAE